MLAVDRIEEGIAVLIYDDGRRKELSISDLPDGTREGTILRETSDGFVIDMGEEDRRRSELAKRARSIFKKK